MELAQWKRDFVFAFCKVCWDYQKMVFAKAIDFEKDTILDGKCDKCKNIFKFNVQEIKSYYEHWDEKRK